MQQDTQRRFPYKLPELNDYNGDISKPWLITYYAWNVDRQVKQRKRIKISEGTTLRERRAVAKREMDEVASFLKNGGYTFDKEPEPEPELVLTEHQYSVRQAVDFYINFCKATLKENTYESYASKLRKLTTYLDDNHSVGSQKASETLTLADLTPKLMMSFLEDIILVQKLSTRTHNNIGNDCSTFFDFWREREVILKNPLEKFEPLITRPRKHTPFSSAQVTAIKEEIMKRNDEQLWLYCCFMYYTFARPDQEVRLLKIGDIREKTIVFRVENAKGNRQESIRIPPGLEELIVKHKLRDYPHNYYVFSQLGRPAPNHVSKSWLYKRHRNVLTAVGLADDQFYCQYSWKPTGVIALYNATKDVKLIQRQCRHTDLQSTDKYLRELGLFLNDDELADFPSI